MARTTRESKLHSEYRYKKLLIKFAMKFDGDADLAIDVTENSLARLWEVAQDWYSRTETHRMIPIAEFRKQGLRQEVIDADFARIETIDGQEYVYASGSKERFQFLIERQEAAVKGGEISAQRQRDERGRLLPKNSEEAVNSKQTPSDVQANSSQDPSETQANSNQSPSDVQAEPSKSNQIQPSFSFSLSSSVSSSNSGSMGEAEKPAKTSRIPGNQTSAVIAAYCEGWRSRYQDRPPIGGKETGIIQNLIRDHGPQQAEAFVRKYCEMTDSWFLTKRHDLATLKENLNVVQHFIATGQQITKQEIREFESSQATRNQLQRIEAGEL